MAEMTAEVKHLLQTEALLNDRVGLLALGGSLAYGTNLPGKGDIDTRGFSFEPAEQLIGGVANFESFVHTESDTVLYSFNKMLSLLLENNPNTLEILGCNPEHYLYIGDVGKDLIENVGNIVTKRVYHTFGGYAKMQLDKMDKIIFGNSIEGKKELEHLKHSLERAMYSFTERYSSYATGSVLMRIVESEDPEVEDELVVDLDMQGCPINQVVGMLNELASIKKHYKNLTHRNNKQDVEHLDKHAMHIIRLLVTGIELVETGKMRTYREKERELLVSIRKGAFRKDDCTYHSSFYDLKAELENKFEYAKKYTVLPDTPNMEWVRGFTYDVNKKIILGGLNTLVL